MNALLCMIADEIEQDRSLLLFRDYVGQCLWAINTIQHMKTTRENEMPQYVELSHPELRKKQMTADEIKQHVLDLCKVGD